MTSSIMNSVKKPKSPIRTLVRVLIARASSSGLTMKSVAK